jgi:hypothetical protein
MRGSRWCVIRLPCGASGQQGGGESARTDLTDPAGASEHRYRSRPVGSRAITCLTGRVLPPAPDVATTGQRQGMRSVEATTVALLGVDPNTTPVTASSTTPTLRTWRPTLKLNGNIASFPHSGG